MSAASTAVPDAGATWKKLAGGLPSQTGRIGLSLLAKNPKVIYALVQSSEGGTQNIDEVVSKRGGVFRSENGGDTWTRTSPLNPRPFYFSQIRVDPQDDRLVYVLGFMLHVSEDGGKTFREDRFAKVHPDTHALTIDPRNPKRMLLGTDGGVYQTYDRATSWTHVNTMAIGEFYRIAVDDGAPYRICGGLQDNLNWVGPSATRTKDGITNADWINIGGGDGFYCAFDPSDGDVVYAESQAGIRPSHAPRKRRRENAAARTAGGTDRLPLPLELAARREPAREGRHVPGRQPRVQTHGTGRVVEDHQPRPERSAGGAHHDRGQRGRELRRRLCARRVAAQAPGSCGPAPMTARSG